MTALEVLEKATAAGVSLTVSDGFLDLDGPEDALTTEMESLLAAHKPELLALVAERDARAAVAHEIALSLEADGHFAFKAGVLDGETVVVVADDRPDDCIRQEWRSFVRYRASEMAALAGADPHSVRIIHELKKLEGATVESRTPAGVGEEAAA